MNKIIAVISTIIFLFVAFWLGEAGRGLFYIFPYIIALIGIVAIPHLASKRLKYRIIVGFSFIAFYAAAFYMGDLSFYQAYNNCLESAEQIRTDLSEYKNRNGRYPHVLDDLNIRVPCSRCLRGSILEYESTSSSYRLWFKDWLVEHSATDKEPFIAHK